MSEPVRTAPFAAFEWLISARYLRARRKEGFISVIAGFSFLGIMLGVATLIIVMAVMNGFRKELLDKILGLNGHLLVQPLESPLTDWKEVADRISGVQGIRLAAPIDEGQGVAIGRRLADSLSLHAGDTGTLVAPRGAVTPMGTTPRIKPYKVAAVFEIGMSEYDSSFVFMPLKESQAYFNRPNAVTAIENYTDYPVKVDEYRMAVTAAAGRPGVLVDGRQRIATFFYALLVERNVMFLFLTVIVLVAALNIISGLIMLVKDKGSDIAILRTMG